MLEKLLSAKTKQKNRDGSAKALFSQTTLNDYQLCLLGLLVDLSWILFFTDLYIILKSCYFLHRESCMFFSSPSFTEFIIFIWCLLKMNKGNMHVSCQNKFYYSSFSIWRKKTMNSKQSCNSSGNYMIKIGSAGPVEIIVKGHFTHSHNQSYGKTKFFCRSLYKQLVEEVPQERFDERRVNLLKSQVIQLERQVSRFNLLYKITCFSESVDQSLAIGNFISCCGTSTLKWWSWTQIVNFEHLALMVEIHYSYSLSTGSSPG